MGGEPYNGIVGDLISLLKKVNRYEDLEEAVKSAVSYDITEMKRLGIFDRSSFLDYMQDLVTTWIPTEDSEAKT